VSASCFARLLSAATEGGWPAVFTIWAEGLTITRPSGQTSTARRSTLDEFLRHRRPDLRAILDDAANQKRDRLLTQLEDEAEQIALGPGDVTQDFDDKGNLRRTRVDRRNKLFAILQLLKAHDRDKYGDHRRVEVAGEIQHTARLTGREGIVIRPEEVEKLLSPEEQSTLLDLLGKIMESRNAERIEGQVVERERRECSLHNEAVRAALMKKRLSKPLSEYERKILGRPGRPGYLWREGRGVDGQGNGVFVTVPITPMTMTDWVTRAAARNAENAKRLAENPDPLGLLPPRNDDAPEQHRNITTR